VHNLNYYLLNASKYFASNTELKFLPGVYQLNAVIKIENVHHFSLTGCLMNGMINNIVECLLPFAGGIVIIKSSYVDIRNINLKPYSLPERLSFASLLIKDSYSLSIYHAIILHASPYNIVLINVLNSSLDNVSSNGMAVIYTDNYLTIKNSKNKLLIHNCNLLAHDDNHMHLYDSYEMVLNFIKYSSGIHVHISNIKFLTDKAIFVYSLTCCNATNKVIFSSCSFNNIEFIDEHDSIIHIYYDDDSCKTSTSKQTKLITFIDYFFTNNVNHIGMSIIKFRNIYSDSLLCITNSQFCNLTELNVLATPQVFPVKHLHVFIKNVTFSQLVGIDFVMALYDTNKKDLCYFQKWILLWQLFLEMKCN